MKYQQMAQDIVYNNENYEDEWKCRKTFHEPE